MSAACTIQKDLPPRSTLYDYFDLWSWDGTLDRTHHELYVKCREAVAREASPTAAVIDSQSVKSAEKGGASIDRPGLRRRKEGASKARITYGGRFHPDSCRLIWKLTSGVPMQVLCEVGGLGLLRPQIAGCGVTHCYFTKKNPRERPLRSLEINKGPPKFFPPS